MLQLSIPVQNARLEAIEAAIGASPILRVFTGSVPANCAAASTGTIVATVNPPADYMTDAAGGVKSMSGTWEDASADAAGTAGYFRLFNAAGTVCGLQGTISATGGGGDMTVDNVVFAAGQNFKITSFTITDGNT
jgi:hypothetical protein